MKIKELFEDKMTPAQGWENLLNAVCSEEGDPDKSDPMYMKAIKDAKPIALMKEILDSGVTMDANTAGHWADDLMGGFIVTHRNYKPPKGADTDAAKKLANYLFRMFGIDDEDSYHRDEDGNTFI